MRISRVTVLALALLGAGAAFAGRTWSTHHVRRWTGRSDLGFVSCNHCHLSNLETISWAQTRPRHHAPFGLAVSPDSSRIFIACDDVDEIVEADAHSLKPLRTAKVPGSPAGLAVNRAGDRLFVACRNSDRVIAIDTRTFKQTDSIEVGDAPVAIAFCQTAAGDRLIVANSLSDNISVLSPEPLREIARPQAGREPYALTVTRDGAVAFVANRLATTESVLSVPQSEMTLIDPARGRVLQRGVLPSAHLAESCAIVAGRGWALTPIVKVRNLVPITQVANGWVMSSGIAICDTNGSVAQLPLDEAHAFFADPSGIVVDENRGRAYVSSAGADTVTVLDLDRMALWLSRADEQTRRDAIDDLSLSAEYVIARIPTGRNPRHLALSRDGNTLFVSEHLNDSVLAIDTAALKLRGRIVLGDGGLGDPIRSGERVFTSAAHTFLHEFSCRSCHPDGHVDGLAYDFDGDGIGDNLLDNRSLQGVAGTGPFKWNGRNPTLQIQCGIRFARVLMRSDPIAGRELDDLVAFINSQPPPRWDRKHNQPLTPEQERGRKIFFATARPDGKAIPRDRRCYTCHRPPLFTNRLPSDIGSRGPRDSTNMFDTPHLLGVAHTAPYLHDGRARTLEELWTTYQTNDMHGVSSYMNKHHLNDLVEYLKTL